MIHGRDIFKVPIDTIIKYEGFSGWVLNQTGEKRTLFVVFHALFTYYSIALCLWTCILEARLTALQKHEALGRLAFCFQKFGMDLKLLNKVDKDGQSLYFTEEGLKLFEPIEALYTKDKF